ncbi:hypothetical protein AGOR_G00132660 [Albula goreensis]|uniref:SOCS box domain-containing protein n=1 Tax=Albula goreensis TaxID=1534307 RepID=A0A8T3D8B2_9TELE|nr:hypothetical protein AGOR_G00132660 [Albula goreensis]
MLATTPTTCCIRACAVTTTTSASRRCTSPCPTTTCTPAGCCWRRGPCQTRTPSPACRWRSAWETTSSSTQCCGTAPMSTTFPVNPTHFPSALQYALKDEVMLRMLLNYGYDAQRCFHCPYGDGSHIPQDYEGWSTSVIKDMVFCEVITVYWLKHISAQLVRVMLDYVDHVKFCSKLKAVLVDQEQWPEICHIQGNPRSLKHLCRLKIRDCMGRRRLRAPVFMSFLPLPRSLKDYILFREYDLYSQGSVEGSR